MFLLNSRMLDPVFIFILLTCALFIGELSPMKLSDVNEQRMLTLVIIFLVVVYMCFPSLSCAGGGLSDVCVFVGVVGFLELWFSF